MAIFTGYASGLDLFPAGTQYMVGNLLKREKEEDGRRGRREERGEGGGGGERK